MSGISTALLIEDNPGDARLLKELLAEEPAAPFRIICVDRLQRGLELLSTEKIDVLLLDLSLPDSHGLETFAKAYAHAPKVPIIVLTGNDDHALALLAVKAGAQDFLFKGKLDRELLIRSMQYSIERKRYQEQLEHQANYDVLTGLPNRNLLQDRLKRAVFAQRDARPIAVVFIDLDHFKFINDSLGHTQGDSFDVLSHRPAPVQASWLGYAGTTAAPFVDYLIADRIVAPDAGGFSEKLAWLPNCFFPSDTVRNLGKLPSRAQAGLPQDAFVFCCFNNTWKITEPVFAAWMRLLAQIPQSVLWLKQAGEKTKENLVRSARDRGIDPDRLVFATPAPLDVHLVRHQLADLFLDTLPYNAHATACDALWAGLPVLTQRGTAFAGRVAASLLTAAGLPELITETAQEYEALALALARDPARLKALREKLATNRATAPLFDTPRLARDLEAAYRAMLAAAVQR